MSQLDLGSILKIFYYVYSNILMSRKIKTLDPLVPSCSDEGEPTCSLTAQVRCTLPTVARGPLRGRADASTACSFSSPSVPVLKF